MTSPSPQPKVHPERQKRVKTSLKLFKTSAWATGTFLILLIISIIADTRSTYDISTFRNFIAIIHGWIYLAYAAASLNITIKTRSKPQKIIILLIYGTIPFLSFLVAKNVSQEVNEKFLQTEADESVGFIMRRIAIIFPLKFL
ncbi:DUF3817 domain-containing protein [Corynebacterium mastitidis]|uniref:DUF3817 domain-containing protein n=1 Tax=Corynebacterium mastitidis TaxID=161890 RepID=A0ABU8P0F4_9CORY